MAAVTSVSVGYFGVQWILGRFASPIATSGSLTALNTSNHIRTISSSGGGKRSVVGRSSDEDLKMVNTQDKERKNAFVLYCMVLCPCVCVCVCVYVSLSFPYISLYVCMYVCMSVCMYVCVCV